MSHPIIRPIILLILTTVSLVGLGQTTQPMIWVEAIQHTKLDKRFSTTLLFQRRVFLNQENMYQHVYWVDGAYKLTSNVTVGGGMIYLKYHKRLDEQFKGVPEVRPFQFLTINQKIGDARLSLRSMIEERFLSTVNGDKVQSINDFSTRYRFRVRTYFLVMRGVTLELSNEVLLNGQNEDRFDQNRAVARLRYSVKSWTFNGGCMDWRVNTSGGMKKRPSLLIGVSHKFSSE